MTLEEVLEIVREEDFDVTLSGGDPLCSPEATEILVSEIKRLGYGIWLFTGFTWERIMQSETLRNIASQVDVVVDGPFVEALHDPDLLFRGSTNQRLVDVKKSLLSGDKPVLFAS